LQFIDNVVDANAGTIKAKAVFENKESKLWPGAYVDVQLSVRTIKDAIVIPTNAIVISPKGSIVYTIDAEGKAALRPVKQVYAAGLDTVVTGVDVGDKVIVDGKQNLRPGVKVKVREADPVKPESGKSESGKPEGKASKSAASNAASAS